MARSRNSSLKALALYADTPTGTTVINSTAVDIRDWNSATVVVTVAGTATAFTDANNIQFSLQHSNTSNADFVDVPVNMMDSDDAAANGRFAFLNGAHANVASYQVGYLGYNRYLRLVIKRTGNAPSVEVGAQVIAGDGNRNPSD